MGNNTYSFTKLYVGIIILLFVIAFGWHMMVGQLGVMPELEVNIYNGSSSMTNLSSFDRIRGNLDSDVNQMEKESGNYSLTGITSIDLPIKYISTIAKLFANLPSILDDTTTVVFGTLPFGSNSSLLRDMLFLLSGLIIVLLVVRLWKNMQEV